MTLQTPPVVLYFDGLCEANPGGWMSWAWVALARGGAEVGCGGKAAPPATANTNNVAEYNGLIAGLTWLERNEVRGIRVRGDSQLVIKQLTGEYRVNSPALRPLYDEAIQKVRALGVTLEWVPRETNHRADALCFTLLPADARPVVEAAIARRAQYQRGRR